MLHSLAFCSQKPQNVHVKGHLQWPQPSWVKTGSMMRCLARGVEGPATEPTFICPAPACVPERTAHIEDTN